MPTENRVVNDEADAFQRLYDTNHRRVLRFLARIAGPQQAEDLSQIVFAKAARALPDFRGDARSSTWLYRIAANVASDWLRGRPALEARVTSQLPEAQDLAAFDADSSSAPVENRTSPEQEMIRKEMRDCIRRLIGRLPEKYWTVLMLGELGGLTDDEVAQTLGITRANARVRLHRARALLKKSLEAHCKFSRDEDNEFVCEPKPNLPRTP
jgi:RNA polymerase sigma-70 factor (ECF subfamily)